MKLIMTAALLYLLLLPETLCALQILPQFYYNNEVCLIDGSFITFRKVTATQCVYECYVRRRCVYLSYHWIMHGCFLHDKESSDSSENEIALSGCFNLDESEINEIGLTVAGKCKERPCSRSTKCEQNSENNTSSYNCVVEHCLQPGALPYAFVPGNSMVKVGRTMRYLCVEGYTMIGLPDVQCLENGTLMYPEFSCFKNCPVPVLSNAEIIYLSNFRHVENSKAIFECNTGYYRPVAR